jgi:hypothetical protein
VLHVLCTGEGTRRQDGLFGLLNTSLKVFGLLGRGEHADGFEREVGIPFPFVYGIEHGQPQLMRKTKLFEQIGQIFF